MRAAWLVLSLAVAVVGCDDPRKKQIEQVGQDETVLKDVNGAVNEVIRNSTDCAAAKPLMLEADRKIEEARPKLTAPASQQTLEALKVQLDRVRQICP